MRLKVFVYALCVAAMLLLGGCSGDPETTSSAAPEAEKVSRTVFAMDTVMEITPYGEQAKAACDAAEDKIMALEQLLSVTLPDSEIYAANHADGASVQLSEDSFALLQDALSWCERTDGALDISIYPVLRTWGFTTGNYRVPENAELKDLLRDVDYTQIRTDAQTRTVTLPQGMEIDLGSVAKGYTGDQVMQVFRDCGVTSGMVSLGGNVQVLGTKPDGTAWRIAVQDPTGEGYAGVVEVTDKAVITSGGYERFFEENGVTYWHILDPATGSPARSGVISATVIGENGTMCDALSTALFVMGADRASTFWKTHDGFDFVLILDDGSLVITQGLESCFTPVGEWENARIEVVRR